MVLKRYSLVEWLKDGDKQSFPKMGLTDKDKEGRIRRIHIEVSDDLQFIEVFDLKEVGFVEDDHRCLFIVEDIVSDAGLNGVKQLGFSVGGFSSQQYRKLPVEVNDIDGRKGGIDRLKEIGVELFDKGADMQGFACSRSAGDEHDSSFAFHMFKAT